MSSKAEAQVRTLSLWFSLLLLLLHVLTSSSQHLSHSVAIGSSFPMWSCFAYQFFHANIFHCLCNVWAMLTLGFLWHPRSVELLLSYLISVLFGLLLWFLPESGSGHILGLSAPIFAFLGLRGMSMQSVRQFLHYNLSICLSNAFLAVFAASLGSSLSWQAHMSCYILGLIIAILNKPIIKTH